jgi:hypothetical protein
MNPHNKFEGFFQSDAPPIVPSTEQCIEAVMTIILQRPDWLKNPELRMIVLKTADGLAFKMLKDKEEGKKIDLHIGYAAFMMMVTEVLDLTRDEYGTDEERRLANPGEYEDEDEDE